MRRNTVLHTIICVLLFFTHYLPAQVGYYDAPYTRYEADLGTLTSATTTTKSYSQALLQSEASGQVCVNLASAGSSVEWTLTSVADGLVIRYSVPDGQSGVIEIFANNVSAGTITLGSTYSWEYLWSNGNPNNVGVVNTNPRMRFDEVRMKLSTPISAGGTLKLVNQSGNIHIDFVEVELAPAAVSPSVGDAVYTGDGSDLQTFINSHVGQTIFVPSGVYNVNRELYFGVANTVLKGAGMWYTEIHFTNNTLGKGGLRANATDISFSDLYLTTVRNSRSNSYKAINGVFTSGSTITNIWAEHFECGAWIAQYNSGAINFADGFTLSRCRFRNNYADGINLCKGTRNAIVEHCSFRNNGDDDMAMWSSDGWECQNNTYRYNTSENCWRAAGCAIYGGYNNKAHHLLIRDNLEVGIRVNNSFAGVGFNDLGVHEFSDITIISCGTFNDLYNNPVGAIDLAAYNTAGTQIKNIKFTNITITNSKNDALYIRKGNGQGFYNLVFENIAIDGTGKEFPNNNAKSLNWGRGYGILFVGNPAGYATYCNITYNNIGGNAASNINNAQIGSLSWTNAGCGTYITAPLSGTSFGICGPAIPLKADASLAYGTVDSVEFFVDGVKVGKDVSAPYSLEWEGFTNGSHTVYARSNYSSPSGAITSPTQTFSVDYIEGLISTATAPVIDGTIESLWDSYNALSLDRISVGTTTGASDLSAYYKITYDATNLYILVEVTDDDLQNDGGPGWQNDGLEIFIDIGNDKTGSYGDNDFSYNFVYNDPTVYESKHDSTTGVTFVQGTKTGGYIMEISIPLSTLGTGLSFSAGDLLGFDVHVDDDDEGGTRDAKISWKDCVDNAWQNPSYLGTLQESGCTSADPTGFISFDASLVNGKAVLNWNTYYRSDDYNFSVLRSLNGGTYQSISTVAASGGSGMQSPKSYTDNNPPAGSVSYRIARAKKDGCNKIMSEIITLSVVTATTDGLEIGSANFYPNPFHTSGNLKIDFAGEGNYSVIVKDINGKTLTNKMKIDKDSLSLGENLPSGVYLLELINDEGMLKQIIRIIKL